VYSKAANKIIFVVLIACLLMILQSGVAFSAVEQADEQQKEMKFTEKMASILFHESKDAFVYKREGRTDPFVPFIEERVEAKQIPVEELTGMRKFEPGQLSVVAIISSPNDRFAMVQDSNNQGYVIREGVLLGRTGVVEKIEPNKVIVKNYTYNLAGDKIYKTVEMVLNQEGEK